LSDLKGLNQTAPRFMTQELDQSQCKHGRPQKFFQGDHRRRKGGLPPQDFKIFSKKEVVFLVMSGTK